MYGIEIAQMMAKTDNVTKSSVIEKPDSPERPPDLFCERQYILFSSVFSSGTTPADSDGCVEDETGSTIKKKCGRLETFQKYFAIVEHIFTRSFGFFLISAKFATIDLTRIWCDDRR